MHVVLLCLYFVVINADFKTIWSYRSKKCLKIHTSAHILCSYVYTYTQRELLEILQKERKPWLQTPFTVLEIPCDKERKKIFLKLANKFL